MSRLVYKLLATIFTTISLVHGPYAQAVDSSSYSNNFYVLISFSNFYKNYRHSIDTLVMYQYLRERGIHDDHILLMMPHDHACSPKTPFPGKMFDVHHNRNWMCEDIEVDLKAQDMTPENFIDLLRDRMDPGTSFAKRM